MHPIRTLSLLASAALVIPLAACGVGSTAGKPEQIKSSTLKRLPGSWQGERVMTAFDTVNLSPAMGSMATDGKRSIGYKNPLGPVCVTQQTAALDTLQLRLDDTSMLEPDWQIKRARLSNGTLDFFATRFDPDSGHSELQITGSITPTLTDLITTYDADEFRPGKGRTHSVWHSRNARVGECTPGEATVG